ncbi:hypothetical protein OG345_41355 (plasmid) [Streptomyces sp. NBC_01220]|uniref:hypothetical protein n=1 Tax=Streptomyces sp. NBC_01220 TaxID=2903781 RepID=UPI002F90CAA1|nr:hypothetical protein OG345_41355 [Streptomyces sp. NBC_01220]
MSQQELRTPEQRLLSAKRDLGLPIVVAICGSTRSEIRYARVLGKSVRFTHPGVDPDPDPLPVGLSRHHPRPKTSFPE